MSAESQDIVASSCILIVETDVLVRHPLAEYLRQCGYRVLEASDEVEARLYFEQSVTTIDIVLADAGADPEGVFPLARWIRDQHPAVDVLLAGHCEGSGKGDKSVRGRPGSGIEFTLRP